MDVEDMLLINNIEDRWIEPETHTLIMQPI